MCVFTNTVFPQLTESLFLHYTFDSNDTTNQGSGGNVFDAVGMNDVTYSVGIGGSAVHIDGRLGQHVVLPTVDFSTLSEWTISMWVNEQAILTGQEEAYLTFGVVGQEVTIFHDTTWPGYPYGHQVGFAITGQTYYSMTKFYPELDSNVWKHYAISYDGSMVSMYIDGNLFESKNLVLGEIYTGGYLGAHNGRIDPTTRFVGSIDEVRMYSSALSSEEIQSLYFNPTDIALDVPRLNIAVPEPNLVGILPFFVVGFLLLNRRSVFTII